MSLFGGLFLLMALGFAYIIYIYAGKEAGQMALMGKFLAALIIIGVVVIILEVLFNADSYIGSGRRQLRMWQPGMMMGAKQKMMISPATPKVKNLRK
jgi:hypothetical protein